MERDELIAYAVLAGVGAVSVLVILWLAGVIG